MKPLTYETHGLKPPLAIVLPQVFRHQRRSPVKSQSHPEGYASLREVPRVLGWVKGDEHHLYCTHNNAGAATLMPTSERSPVRESRTPGSARGPGSN